MIQLQPDIVQARRPAGELTLELVRSVEDVAALKDDYARLHRVAGYTLPFALHDWHVTWCRHFLNVNPRIRDLPMFHVLRNAEGACVAIIPLIFSRRRLGLLKVVSVNLLGADPAITEIRTPLVEPGYEYQAARAVQDSLIKVGRWDWIHWTGINRAFSDALTLCGNVQWQPTQPNYLLDLPPTWEEFRAGLKRNIRESLRHCYNSLKRDGHAFEFQIATQPAHVRKALDRFLELHTLRSHLSHTIDHPDRFASQVSQRFLYEVCERMAASGTVRVFQLKVGAQIVAARIGFVVGDSLYLYYSGFDPNWSRYSVMTTTVAEAIKYAIAHRLKTIDLSPGTDTSKTRWGPREVRYQTAYVPAGRLRSRLARRAYLKARSGIGVSSKLLRRLIAARRQWS